MDFPSEITVIASSLRTATHEAMTESKRFNFRLASERGETRLFTARAEQAETPGLIRIFDIRPVAEIDVAN
jgi:hypothetical protein